jgi:hypothetical protein
MQKANSTWGGKREGAGRPITHNDPAIKERAKKFRAIDKDWAYFLSRLPDNTEDAFDYLYYLVVCDNLDWDGD